MSQIRPVSNSKMVEQNLRSKEKNSPKFAEPSAAVAIPESDDDAYGWLSCRPSFLQPCLATGWILSSCCFYVFFQQFIVTGISNVVVTSLEKRFFLKSSQAGTIFSCFDIGNLILTIFVSYFGYRHKPKWLGCGALVFALGCFLFALPQFLADKFKPVVSTSTDLCLGNSSNFYSNFTPNSEGQESISCRDSKWYNLLLLVAGQLAIGAGSSPLFNLGPSYLDENVSQKNSGLVIALYFSVATLGSGTGFILGGYFLAIYVDFVQVL